MKKRKTQSKLLTAATLTAAMLVAASAHANSALEDAINNEAISIFNLNSDQQIENNLGVLNREFTIVDKTLTHEINGYSHKGFVNNNTLSIFAKSIDNFSTTGNGGIIYSGPNTNLNIYGARETNEDKYILTGGHADGDGGAVYLNGLGSVVVADRGTNGINVKGNDADGNGGAFAISNGGFLELRNTSVDGNTTRGAKGGGGIYSNGGNVKVKATNDTPVLIKMNISSITDKGNDIYAENGSDISLTTDDTQGSSITVGDIYLDSSKLTKSGNVVIDNLSMNNSVLHTADGQIDNSIKELNLSGTNYWTLDADFDNVIADKINTEVTGNGTINLTLNPLSMARGDIEALDLGLNSLAGIIVNANNLQIDETMYNLSVNNDKTIKITLGQERMGTLQSALADAACDSFVLEQGYATSMNLGTMVNNNTGNRTFTINGNDGEYYNGIQAVHPTQESDYLPSGIKVTDGETLNIKDVAYFSNFRKKDPDKANGATIEAYNADISITNPNNPNKTEFTGNTLTYTNRGGGAIYIEGGNGKDIVPSNSLTIDKAVFKNNYSGNDGGAIYAREVKDINITNTDFIGNKAGEGAAIYVRTYNNTNDPTTVNLENVTFSGNGGGQIGSSKSDVSITITDYKKHNSTVNIKDAEFTGRTGGYTSASIRVGGSEYRYNFKSTTLDGINIHDNKDSRAIVAANMGTLTLKNSTIANNTNDSALDALIYVNNVDRTIIDNTTFDNNRAVLIETHEDITIKDSTITNNILNLQHGNTGMIELDYSDLTMNLDNLTVDNNEVFSENNSYWGVGLIENYGSHSTINFNGGTYTNNKAHVDADIIVGDWASKFVLNDVKFQNNTVENTYGGMIGSSRRAETNLAQRIDIYINAVNDNVVFSGNSAPNGKVNDLYVPTSSKTYLNASAGHSINMEDIYVEHRPDAETFDHKKFPTQLYLNDKEGSTGTINIGKITLENGAELRADNKRIDTYSTIGNLTLVGEASKLFIDADLSDNSSDKFTGIDVSNGELKLAVNILNPNTSSSGGSITLFSGDIDNGFKILDASTQYGDDKYTFTQNAIGSGVMDYKIVKDRSLSLSGALADYTVSEYDMPDYTVATSNLGRLAHYDNEGYFVERTFTINGNNGILTSDTDVSGILREGISIPTHLNPPEEDFLTPKLIVNDLEAFSGFATKASAETSFAQGGAIDAEDSVLEVNNVTFFDNVAAGDINVLDNSTFGLGGAIYLATKNGNDKEGDAFKSIINNSSFINNKTISVGTTSNIVDGGGAVFSKGNLDIADSLFTNNSAISEINRGIAEAGALYVSNNSDGGASNRDVNITGTMFMSNIAGDVQNNAKILNTEAYGGAVYISRADVNISGSSFIDNIAQAAGDIENEYDPGHLVKAIAAGGAISVDKLITNAPYGINIDNSIFTMNKAQAVKSIDNGDRTYTLSTEGVDQGYTFGGAIAVMPVYASSKMIVNIKDSDFLVNEAGSGGAIYNNGSNVTIKDSTFSNNTANYYYIDPQGDKSCNEDMLGGAIFNSGTGLLTLDGVTFSNNTAQQIADDNINVNTVRNDIRNNGSLSGGLYFTGKASTLDGGISGSGYTYFNLDNDQTMNIAAETNISQLKVEVNSGTVNLEDASSLEVIYAVTVGENGTLNIESGTLNDKYGSLEVENNGTINGTFTNNATFTNNGIMNGYFTNNSANFVNSGTMEAIIENEGTFTNYGTIYGAIVNNGTLTSDANMYAIVENNGDYNIIDGLITAPITGTGDTYIGGTVTNNATVENNMIVSADSVFNSSADGLLGTVNTLGTLNIDGGTITNDITGTGTTNILGTVVTDFDATTTGNVNVTSGSTLGIGTNATNLFANAAALNVGEGATLNLMNGVADAINTNIVTDSNINLKLDWGDTINATNPNNVNGSVLINEIDLSATDGSTQQYTLTNTINDNIFTSTNINLITTENSSNLVTYNRTLGTFTSKYADFSNAINSIGVGEEAVMSILSDAQTNGDTLLGSLILNGNGNSIVGNGIVVGDGVNEAALLMKDTNLSNIDASPEGNPGAVLIRGGSVVLVSANDTDVVISGSKSAGNQNNAFYLNTDVAGNSVLSFFADKGRKITINDNIISDNKNNLVMFEGDIDFNGLFDPATSEVNGGTLTRNGYDDEISWKLNGGTLRYTNDNYLFNPVRHFTSYGLNSMEFNGGALDLRNGAASTILLSDITLNADSNIYLDADLANETMDNFSASPATVKGGYLNVAGIKLLSDSKYKSTVSINFTQDTDLQRAIRYTGEQGISYSPLYKYNVGYNSYTGDFTFVRYGNPAYGEITYEDMNPAAFVSPVAEQMAFLNQLNSYQEAFASVDTIMNMPSSVRKAMALRNKTASAEYSAYDSTQDSTGVWFKPYATFEKVGLKGGSEVDNFAYGGLVGVDLGMKEYSNGWSGLYNIYGGYTGSHQNFEGNSIYQNGGLIGLTGVWYKDNFFTGLTANVGASAVETNTMFGRNDYALMSTGISSKTGYNWELFDGRFIIQPSWQMSYSLIKSFNHTDAADGEVSSDALNAVTLQPGLKFIGNLPRGWQPYAGVSMVWNIMDKTRFDIEDTALPEMSVKPYIQYGVGVKKSWGDRFSGFGQIVMRNGGRNGISLQAGFRWMLGKDNKKISETENTVPELRKAQISLSNQK